MVRTPRGEGDYAVLVNGIGTHGDVAMNAKLTEQMNGETDALIVVDVQKDFCPGGALAISDGEEIIPLLNRWIEAAKQRGATIVASRDWHPLHHVSFKERGGPWPAHCIRETAGAEFHDELALPEDATILSKATDKERENYSAFDGSDLADRLRRKGVRRLWVGGLAQEICVFHTCLDGVKEDFEVRLLLPATRPANVNPGDGGRAVDEMRAAGVVIHDEAD
jgi:nicotinamidase/pyrazinamidase